jgi:hypothetical protein
MTHVTFTFCVVCATSLAVFAAPGGAQTTSPPTRIQMPRPAPPTPPRDTSARPPAPEVGTATLSGRVVAAETGLPLRRATVSAMSTRPPAPPRRGEFFSPPRPFSARTDDDGRFVIREVPAGEYMLTARRAGYVDQSYGQVTQNAPGRRVNVADGAAVGPLQFALIRGGVITGRVVDETGEPAERVQVRAVRAQRIGGQVRYLGGPGDTTDDQGHYRMFGLVPGEYLVVAEPGDRNFFRGSPAIQNVDVDTVPTYGPGTVNPAEAVKVQVQPNAEAAMDIQLVAARVATVRGRVLTSRGEPLQGGMVRLQAVGAESMTGMGRGGPVMAGGLYEIDGVPPGAYMIFVEQMMRGGPDGPDEDGPLPESASESVTVEGEDLVVPLTTSPGSTARGRVIVEGGDPSLVADRNLRVMAFSPTPTMRFGSMARGRVASDLSFTVSGLRGTQVLSLQGLPEGWWVKDIRVSGESGIDGFDFGATKAFAGVEIVVSGRVTGLTGTVTMPTGATAEDYAVVVFPQDEEKWERGNGTGARITRPGLDGAYKLPGLRPGRYYALAVPAAQADYQLLSEPDQLRVLAGRARTVEVRDGEMSPLSLTLVER